MMLMPMYICQKPAERTYATHTQYTHNQAHAHGTAEQRMSAPVIYAAGSGPGVVFPARPRAGSTVGGAAG